MTSSLRPGRDGGAIGAEAGLEGDGGFNAFEGGDTPFQLFMQINGTGDGAHCTWSDAIFIDGILGSFAHAGIIGQAKIIV